MSPESQSHRDLKVLEAIAEDQGITQRRLAVRLGVALGLANLNLQRLAREGYIRCITARTNRRRYLLTPKGVAEKTRLTYDFMQYSLSLYRQVRQHLRNRLQPIADRSPLRIAICGTGEAAELAYLSLKEMNVEPAAILGRRAGTPFLGLPVFDIGDHPLEGYDVIIAATLAEQDVIAVQLTQRGVPSERIVMLRPVQATRSRGIQPRPGAHERELLAAGSERDKAVAS